MKYQYIWFDLGLTLVKTPIKEIYQKVLESFGIRKEIDEIGRAFHLADKNFMRNYPHVLGSAPSSFLPWYLGVLNYYLGVQINLFDNYRALSEKKAQENCRWELIPGVLEVLTRLKEKGYGVGLISNWDSSCRTVLQDNKLDALLDIVVISAEVGIEKPDERIFRLALDKAGITGAQSLYVGDNYYDDVVGAKKVDMQCLLLSPFGKLGMEEINHPYSISCIEEVECYLE